MPSFKKITEEKGLRGKRVIVRLDWNVPIVGDEVRDDFRIQRSLPVLQFLQKEGAKTIVISHLENDLTDSLSLIAKYVGKLVPLKAFVENYADAPAAVAAMNEGETIVLENLRKASAGEKANDPAFAAQLAALADIYVNDAFAVSHRPHASVVGVPQLLPAFAGPLLSTEIEELSKSFNPPHPFLFILGGAKFDTKLPLIEKFIGIADKVLVGGALANDVYKEKGYEVGRSLVAKARVNLACIITSPRLIVPSDVVAVSAGNRVNKLASEVGPDENILDAGSKTASEVAEILKTAKFVLWNGPVGDYVNGYSKGTEDIARAIVASGAKSIIGGGDTIAVVAKIGLLDKFGFASTGGGAMIEFLSQGSLPGIEALKK